MAAIHVVSEVTGTVWKLEVAPGQAVLADQCLMLVESMKMEIPVVAPRAGVLQRWLVKEGELVEEGQDVAVLE